MNKVRFNEALNEIIKLDKRSVWISKSLAVVANEDGNAKYFFLILVLY